MIERSLWRSVLGVCCIALAASACGGSNIQLQFQTPSKAAQSHRCYAMDKTKPDTKEPNCVDGSAGDEERATNSGATHVLIAKCDRTPDPYVYYTITILNADSDHPEALVTCGQNPPVVQ